MGDDVRLAAVGGSKMLTKGHATETRDSGTRDMDNQDDSRLFVYRIDTDDEITFVESARASRAVMSGCGSRRRTRPGS